MPPQYLISLFLFIATFLAANQGPTRNGVLSLGSGRVIAKCPSGSQEGIGRTLLQTWREDLSRVHDWLAKSNRRASRTTGGQPNVKYLCRKGDRCGLAQIIDQRFQRWEVRTPPAVERKPQTVDEFNGTSRFRKKSPLVQPRPERSSITWTKSTRPLRDTDDWSPEQPQPHHVQWDFGNVGVWLACGQVG